MKKKLTRNSLQTLRETMNVLNDDQQREIIGGCKAEFQLHGRYETDSFGNITWIRTSECNIYCSGYDGKSDYSSGSEYYASGSEYPIRTIFPNDSGYPSGSGHPSGSGYETGSGGGTTIGSITFSPNADASVVSAHSLSVLSQLGDITVTSTARSPERQAAAMYDNIVKGKHVDYAAPGTAVQNVYNPSLSRDQNIANMTAEIYRQGPSNVSKHCITDFSQINVVDISISNVSSDQLANLKSRGLIKSYIVEKDCYHIVIGQ